MASPQCMIERGKHIKSAFRAFIALLVLTLSIVLLWSGVTAVGAGDESATITSTWQSDSSEGCDLDWRVVPSPNIGTDPNLLHDVAVISASDVWAVGSYSDRAIGNRQTLIQHWDGVQWSIVPHPQPGTPGGVLYGINAVSPNDVWAVGYKRSDPNPAQTLILHWDGNGWDVVPSPSPGVGGNGNILQAVSALSADDAWAVGYYFGQNHQQFTLTLHWDGTQWTQVPSPSPGASIKYLYDVDMLSPTDVWAVGDYFDSSNNLQTLAIHWNGTQWTVTPTPNPGTGGNLRSVSALAANDVWAVGYYHPPNGPEQTLTAHWDGAQWTQVPSPNQGDIGNYLYGVDAVASDDVWAVGSYYRPDPDNPKVIVSWTLTEHWDGTQWHVVQSPHPGVYRNSLLAVEALSGTDVWAVGYLNPGSGREETLVERYSNHCIFPTPVSTATPPTSTSTPSTPTSTAIPTAAPSVTPEPATATAIATLSATPTTCSIGFIDVPLNHTFYASIRCLACRGILGGYSDGTFRPNNDITRGQIAKVVSNAAGFNEPPEAQIYEDVPPSNTFYPWINRLSRRGHMGGYQCGTVPGEPCGGTNSPYFRPNASATRGQLAKIVASAASITGTPTGQRYADVAPDSTFYIWIEQLSNLGVMGGYACGSMPTEPCDDQNRPYFRPSNNVTRGQASKIVANAFFPACQVRE